MPRGRPENLKRNLTPEEAREQGRKGGIKSGEVRRRKRAMRDAAQYLLNMPIKSESVEAAMKALGFEEKDLTNQMAMLVSVWKEAMAGNVQAASFLRDTVGQNPIDMQKREEFEYKVEKDQGIGYEMEDMDDIEEEIYGKEEKKSRKEGKSEKSQDD